jgi:hypothetical protein
LASPSTTPTLRPGHRPHVALTSGSRNTPNLAERIPRRIRVPLVLEPVRNVQRHRLAIEVRNIRIDAIHPRRDARRRPDIAIDSPSCDGLPDHFRTLWNRPRPGALVRRRVFPVKDSCTGEERRAGADRNDVLELRVLLLDVCDEIVVHESLGQASATRHDEHVEILRRVLECVGRLDRGPEVRADADDLWLSGDGFQSGGDKRQVELVVRKRERFEDSERTVDI